MSQQLQELIHRSSHVAFESGANAERYRIIKVLEDQVCEDNFCIHDACIFALEIIELIQEQQK
jgi:hypothetical protein